MTAGAARPSDSRSEPESSQPENVAQAPCTAVIVTYQSAGHIGVLLEALQAERQTGLDLDVIVVDNASTDGTPQIVAQFGWVTLVASGGNYGYAAGVNIGSRLVSAERAVLVLNPDLVLGPGTLALLLGALQQPPVGVVVPRIENADGSLCPSLRNEPSVGRALVDAVLGDCAARLPRGWSGMIWDPQAYDRVQFPDWATGAALLVSSACRRAVGDWDERYFLYSEEVDFLRRVRAAGLRVRYEPSAVVQHARAGSGTSDSHYALYTMNLVRYYRRYHASLTSGLFAAVIALHQLLRCRRPAPRLALRALLSPAVRSTLPKSTSPPAALREPG
ncbi:MAG: glycosyltransferase family 2 protein [Streptosporangiaceae bacterium]